MTAAPPDRAPARLAIDRIDTPIGVALLATDEEGVLRAFDWSDHETRLRALMIRYNPGAAIDSGPAPAATRAELTAYFDGDLAAITRIPWRTGGTEFQLSCWRALCDIPAGTTASYGQQAARIGRPTVSGRWGWPMAPTRSAWSSPATG